MKIRAWQCIFEKDIIGFYILPLVGFSKIKGNKEIAFWFGWVRWLWTIKFEFV